MRVLCDGSHQEKYCVYERYEEVEVDFQRVSVLEVHFEEHVAISGHQPVQEEGQRHDGQVLAGVLKAHGLGQVYADQPLVVYVVLVCITQVKLRKMRLLGIHEQVAVLEGGVVRVR